MLLPHRKECGLIVEEVYASYTSRMLIAMFALVTIDLSEQQLKMGAMRIPIVRWHYSNVFFGR